MENEDRFCLYLVTRERPAMSPAKPRHRKRVSDAAFLAAVEAVCSGDDSLKHQNDLECPDLPFTMRAKAVL